MWLWFYTHQPLFVKDIDSDVERVLGKAKDTTIDQIKEHYPDMKFGGLWTDDIACSFELKSL